MASMKEGPGLVFEMLTDVCSVDEYESKPRFDVIYHLRSLETGDMARIKVHAEGDPPMVPSMVSLYPTADWHEREAFDMMGIRFEGHPNLTRILMYEEFEGHPLRKDYPIRQRQPLIGPNPTRSPWREGKWPPGAGTGPGEPEEKVRDPFSRKP